MPVSCVVVIPTRNRAALAKNAVQSVLAHPGSDIQLLVSDNSTDPAERSALASFCAGLRNDRLRYVTPPEPLPMPHHWEFAVGAARAYPTATHFVILTDRMVFRRGMLRKTLELVAERPDVVVSYNDDMVHDKTAPVRLERKNLTGRVLDLDPGQLLYLSSIGVFPQALPRMLNCVVPRAALDRVRARFGDAFTSVAPDLCFAYRCLGIDDTVRYFDAPVLAQYGFAKSNGTGYYDKTTNDAWTDFNRNGGARGLTFATPIPELCCNLNIVYHEYCFVREQARDDARFPAVNWPRYVHAIAYDIHACGNPQIRERLFALLRERAGADLLGWAAPAEPAPAPKPPERKGLWAGLSGAVRSVLTTIGGRPDGDLTFKTTAAALAYSDRVAPAFVPTADHVQYMQRGWKLAG